MVDGGGAAGGLSQSDEGERPAGALCEFRPAVLCGDFNSVGDSDEIRMLTGKAAVPAPPLVFRDVWELVPGEG